MNAHLASEVADLNALPGTGPVTLLFSDLVDFTGLTLRLGDLAAHRVMHGHNQMIRAEVARWHGREVERLGDGFLLAFPTADQGVGCAVAIQTAFARQRAAGAQFRLRVRIGVHAGLAVVDGDRYFGNTVIQCARIAELAKADEILISRETAESCREPVALGPMRRIRLKGYTERKRVCSVQWSALTRPVQALRDVPFRTPEKVQAAIPILAMAGQTLDAQ